MRPIPLLSLLRMRRSRVAPLVLAAVTFASGCAGGWRGDTYHRHRLPRDRAAKETTFRFGLPGEQWRAVRDQDDVQVAWVHPDLAAFIEIHAQCDDQGDSSLHQYTDHLRIDWSDWKVVEQRQVNMVGREALRTVVDAELDGVARRNEFVVLKKNGCLFDLRYSAKPSTFERGRVAFEQVVSGFQFPV